MKKSTVAMLRKRLKQNSVAAKHFEVREALRQEGTPESRKAAKAMLVQYHGSRRTHPGLYFQPNGALSARG